MKSNKFSPRLSLFVGMGCLAVLALGLSGCGNTPPAGANTATTSTAGKVTPGSDAKSGGDVLSIGFIYVGPKDDYGYNQAHADGAAAVKKMPGVKVMEEETVPETVDVQKTMKSMIELDGAKLIFPTSFGYFDPHVLEMAKKYPNVMFLHCGGLWDEKKHPKNVGSYFGYIDECQYLSRHRRRPHDQVQEARLRGGQADPAGAPQHQRLHAGRPQRRSDHHLQRDLHRRLVDAGQRGRGHQ